MDTILETDRPSLTEGIIYLAWKYQVNMDIVNPLWFRDSKQREIWNKIRVWNEKKKGRDIILFNDDVLAMIVSKCEDFAVLKSAYKDYVKVFEKESVDVEIAMLMEECKYEKTDENIKRIRKFVERIEHSKGGDTSCAIPSVVADHILSDLEKRQGEKEPRLRTGFPSIDTKLWGLHPGEIVTVGARTGRGKSTLMLNFTVNLIKRTKRVLIFSSEMSVEETWHRILSNLTGVEAWKFRRAHFDQTEWAAIHKATEWLHDNNNFIVSELPSPNIRQIRSAIIEHKPDVVVIDYIGLFTFPKEDRKDQAIGEFMKQIKIMARSYNVAMLVVSQLNRQVDVRPKQIPTLSDLKESGSIEQESDVVILMYDDPEGVAGDARSICISIEKNRHGETGLSKITFDAARLRMKEQPTWTG